MAARYPLLFDPANAGHLWIVERDGQLLSHAGFCLGEADIQGRTVRTACFGAVFTVEAARGQGLAAQALAAAIAAASAAGAEWGIISGSGALYARAGFVRLAALPTYRVPAAAPVVSVEPATLSDVPALAALYDAEPIRFRRSPSEWRQLLAAGILFVGPATVWVVRKNARAFAYLAVNDDALDDPGFVRVFRALEVAGDRQALADAAGGLAHQLGGAALLLVNADVDGALAQLAVQRGWLVDQTRFAFSAARWTPALVGVPVPWYGLNFV